MNITSIKVNQNRVIPPAGGSKKQDMAYSNKIPFVLKSTPTFNGNNPSLLKTILKEITEHKKIRDYITNLSKQSRKELKELLKEAKMYGIKFTSNDDMYTFLYKIRFERDLKPEARKLGIAVTNNDNYYSLYCKISLEKDLKPKAKKLGISVTEKDDFTSLDKKIKFEAELKKEAEGLKIEVAPNENYDTLFEKIQYRKLRYKAENLGITISEKDDVKTLDKKISEKIKFDEEEAVKKARLQREQELEEYNRELEIQRHLLYYN